MIRRLLVVAALSSIAGCAAPPPDDFPSLRPVAIKVLNDGAPLENVLATLVPADGADLRYVVLGKTDAKGNVSIRTIRGTYDKPGAPEGEYRVLLTQNFKIEIPEPAGDPDAPMSAREEKRRQDEYDRRVKELRVVPVQLGDQGNSPLLVQVDSKGGSLEVDVARYH